MKKSLNNIEREKFNEFSQNDTYMFEAFIDVNK